MVHNITNYVTSTDCDAVLNACGAVPVMLFGLEEAEDITSFCGGLNINTGTMDRQRLDIMLSAGKTAQRLGHPVLLDPVGAGSSNIRTQTALTLMENIDFTVIKGNISEIKTLAYGSGHTKGVDANIDDRVTDENLEAALDFIKAFSKRTNAVTAVTGNIDIVAFGDKAFCIRNGHKMMSSITGAGCMLSSMMTAYVTANRDCVHKAAAAAVCAMGLCGEIAYKHMKTGDGNAAYRNYLIDAVYNLRPEELERGAEYEIR